MYNFIQIKTCMAATRVRSKRQKNVRVTFKFYFHRAQIFALKKIKKNVFRNFKLLEIYGLKAD